MLRFNDKNKKYYFGTSEYFNTSYVTVQRNYLDPLETRRIDFNTSYVTVQRVTTGIKLYHVYISIHPMLRFNFMQLEWAYKVYEISIHPMLRFNGLEEVKI